MRIVVLGLSVTSSWGNGHATTYRALLRGCISAVTMSSFWSATNRGIAKTETCHGFLTRKLPSTTASTAYAPPTRTPCGMPISPLSVRMCLKAWRSRTGF